MKKLHYLLCSMALFAIGATSCVNEDTSVEKQTSTLTLSFCFQPINEGNSMSRGVGNTAIFADFYAAIMDGRLVVPTYDLTFTEVNTGEVHQIKGSWNTRENIEMKMGVYNVSGTSTAKGKYIQEKCSITINDTNVVLDMDDATLSLQAAYDCALVVFDDDSLTSVVNYTEESASNLFVFDKYIYAFVNDKICAESGDSYLVGTRKNGSQFAISTNTQPFDKGKYYIYDTTYNNSLENNFVLPNMNEGKVGVVASITDNICIRNLKYDEFTIDVELDATIKEQDHVLKWATTDLYSHNYSLLQHYQHTPSSDFLHDCLNLHDTAWEGKNIFKESGCFVVCEENNIRYSKDEEFYSSLYYNIMPGQPQVVMFGEFSYGESNYGWGMGYYKPCFQTTDYPQHNEGLIAKVAFVVPQPKELGDCIESVVCNPMDGNATIEVKVDRYAVEEVCIAVYDDTLIAETVKLLDNNADYLQWFATSEAASVRKISLHLTPDSSGIVTVQLTDYEHFKKNGVSANTSIYVDVVALAGDYNGDGTMDSNRQHYNTYAFSLAAQ